MKGLPDPPIERLDGPDDGDDRLHGCSKVVVSAYSMGGTVAIVRRSSVPSAFTVSAKNRDANSEIDSNPRDQLLEIIVAHGARFTLLGSCDPACFHYSLPDAAGRHEASALISRPSQPARTPTFSLDDLPRRGLDF